MNKNITTIQYRQPNKIIVEYQHITGGGSEESIGPACICNLTGPTKTLA